MELFLHVLIIRVLFSSSRFDSRFTSYRRMPSLKMAAPDDPFDQWPSPDSLDLEASYRELSRLLEWEEANLGVPANSPPCSPSSSDSDNEDEPNEANESNALCIAENPNTASQSNQLCSLESRRLALRRKAMELSRSRIRNIHILNFPAEILHNIFSSALTHPAKYGYPHDSLRNYIRNIRHSLPSIRLACRLFNQFASPYLINGGTLGVKLDQVSLDRIEGFSANPLIATAIREVVVNLDYCPQQLATDVMKFKEYMLSKFEYMQDLCDEEIIYDLDDPLDNQHPMTKYEVGACNFRAIQTQWHTINESTATNIPSHHQFGRDLVDCYRQYQVQQKRQLELITSGSFVRAIASAVSRLPRFSRLVIDTSCSERDILAIDPLISRNGFRRFMTRPLNWCEIEDVTCGAYLPPARILTELPVALHRAGMSRYELSISCFPVISPLSAIWPPEPQPGSENPRIGMDRNWGARLHSACQGLTKFAFMPEKWTIFSSGYRYTAVEIEHLHIYLSAAICSPDLEELWLSLGSFAPAVREQASFIMGDTVSGSSKSFCEIGAVLNTVIHPLTRMKRFSLSSASLDPEELERFCNLLERVQSLHLNTVRLTGSWASVLDALRSRFALGGKSTACSVTFSRLHGGQLNGHDIGYPEPEDQPDNQQWDDENWVPPPISDRSWERFMGKARRLENYVLGREEEMSNPLCS